MPDVEPVSSPEHWDDRYRTVGSTQVSWYQPRPETSLRMIQSVIGAPADAAIVDVGGGASTLVDALVSDGHRDVTVVDISAQALQESAVRLALEASDPEAGHATVHWIQADIREWEPEAMYDLWHDRAVYHFLTERTDQQHYWNVVRDHVRVGGHVVMATFAEDGPTMCSGLPVQRYSAEELLEAMGEGFALVASAREMHRTPSGGEQAFTWVVARRA